MKTFICACNVLYTEVFSCCRMWVFGFYLIPAQVCSLNCIFSFALQFILLQAVSRFKSWAFCLIDRLSRSNTKLWTNRKTWGSKLLNAKYETQFWMVYALYRDSYHWWHHQFIYVLKSTQLHSQASLKLTSFGTDFKCRNICDKVC